MKQFEYTFISTECTISELNEYGEIGWEIIGPRDAATYIAKREKTNEDEAKPKGGTEAKVEILPKDTDMDEVFKKKIEKALKETDWNKRRAADLLGISERTLYKSIKKYNIKK